VWDGKSYRGTITLQESARWYFRISTDAPVPAMESDQGIGYSGTRYAWDVLPDSTTSPAFPRTLIGALVAIAILAVIVPLAAMRRNGKFHLTRPHLRPKE